MTSSILICKYLILFISPSEQRHYKSAFQPICKETGGCLSGAVEWEQRSARHFQPHGPVDGSLILRGLQLDRIAAATFSWSRPTSASSRRTRNLRSRCGVSTPASKLAIFKIYSSANWGILRIESTCFECLASHLKKLSNIDQQNLLFMIESTVVIHERYLAIEFILACKAFRCILNSAECIVKNHCRQHGKNHQWKLHKKRNAWQGNSDNPALQIKIKSRRIDTWHFRNTIP